MRALHVMAQEASQPRSSDSPRFISWTVRNSCIRSTIDDFTAPCTFTVNAWIPAGTGSLLVIEHIPSFAAEHAFFCCYACMCIGSQCTKSNAQIQCPALLADGTLYSTNSFCPARVNN